MSSIKHRTANGQAIDIGAIVDADGKYLPKHAGWREDYSGLGILRTRNRGVLEMVPFRAGTYQVSGTTNVGKGLASNPDGTSQFISLQPAAGLAGGVLTIPFSGSVFGFYFRRNNASTIPEAVSVEIDHVVYRVELTDPYYTAEGISLTSHVPVIVADDLPELGPGKQHLARITVLGEPLASKALALYGLILQKSATRDAIATDLLNQPTTGTVPTTMTAIESSTGTTAPLWLSEVNYINQDATTHTVTVEIGTGVTVDQIVIEAGKSGRWSPPGKLPHGSNVRHKVDSGSLVKFAAYGGF